MVNISMTRILKRLHLTHKLSFRPPGLKLLKTTESWNRANEFFKSTLDVSKKITNVDENICHLQDNIYEYFTNECGTVSENGIYAEFRPKYDHLPKRQLKIILIIMKFVTFQS